MRVDIDLSPFSRFVLLVLTFWAVVRVRINARKVDRRSDNREMIDHNMLWWSGFRIRVQNSEGTCKYVRRIAGF